ncbi:hypothetical protein PAXRUDRAFT_177612, partial [Paxillus rubicundulus Ve08.2h10]
VNKFCVMADNTSKVPKLKGKKYADYTISEEWKMLELIYEVPKGSIEKGLVKLKKYYQFLDQNNVAFICLGKHHTFSFISI